MEKSWNFEIVSSHGKIMEFDNQILHSYESAPLAGSLSKSKQCAHRLRGHGICDTVMEKSWKNHGILSQKFLGNPIVN